MLGYRSIKKRSKPSSVKKSTRSSKRTKTKGKLLVSKVPVVVGSLKRKRKTKRKSIKAKRTMRKSPLKDKYLTLGQVINREYRGTITSSRNVEFLGHASMTAFHIYEMCMFSIARRLLMAHGITFQDYTERLFGMTSAGTLQSRGARLKLYYYSHEDIGGSQVISAEQSHSLLQEVEDNTDPSIPATAGTPFSFATALDLTNKCKSLFDKAFKPFNTFNVLRMDFVRIHMELFAPSSTTSTEVSSTIMGEVSINLNQAKFHYHCRNYLKFQNVTLASTGTEDMKLDKDNVTNNPLSVVEFTNTNRNGFRWQNKDGNHPTKRPVDFAPDYLNGGRIVFNTDNSDASGTDFKKLPLGSELGMGYYKGISRKAFKMKCGEIKISGVSTTKVFNFNLLMRTIHQHIVVLNNANNQSLYRETLPIGKAKLFCFEHLLHSPSAESPIKIEYEINTLAKGYLTFTKNLPIQPTTETP